MISEKPNVNNQAEQREPGRDMLSIFCRPAEHATKLMRNLATGNVYRLLPDAGKHCGWIKVKCETWRAANWSVGAKQL
jgi:hypothetical protein